MEISRISAATRHDLNHIVRLLEDCGAITTEAVEVYKNRPTDSVCVYASIATVNGVLSLFLDSNDYPYTSFQLEGA